MSSESSRRRARFGDCALIEIIHLHDCLRGAVARLQADVEELDSSEDAYNRIAGRFHVIWSVFRAHSSAEDAFIWPALNKKASMLKNTNHNIVEEYEEDHADEERMFEEMDLLIKQFRSKNRDPELVQKMRHHTAALATHLQTHLSKEETECMPLVVEHLTKEEIEELVGQIMGQRSAQTIAQIMTMAVQNLEAADRDEMVRYMKQAMRGTFFDRWLQMSGWMAEDEVRAEEHTVEEDKKRSAQVSGEDTSDTKKPRSEEANTDVSTAEAASLLLCPPCQDEPANPKELEKFIRAIATNPALTSTQKNQYIQGLRDSVWKSNKRRMLEKAAPPVVVNSDSLSQAVPNLATPAINPVSAASTCRRVTPPSMFYKKTVENKVELVWTVGQTLTNDIPRFSASELAPTFHDGAAASILGCPHYARSCKLRHPVSGRLYTCRLCCEQERDLRNPDEPLDRYAVQEVLCMSCQALQPAGDRCLNPDCQQRIFAKYFCRICHLYDGDKDIFHCPYCNCCRLGKGLGIDFRHCMRCNACVSLKDDSHQCIPQKLQGSCPICHESLFYATEALRGLKCGHVMHLSCFTEYRRGQTYTCPLCMRSMDDMKDYFAMLDTAIRMQPMPASYLNTMSNIYCQDCGKTGQVQYHFVGLKCSCGSYNTREMGRVDVSGGR